MATNDSAWGQEWRADVGRQLAESAKAHQQTAVILERLSNRLDEGDRRITSLEGKPDRLRNDLASYGGCSSQLVYAGFTAFNTVLGVAAILFSVLHKP